MVTLLRWLLYSAGFAGMTMHMLSEFNIPTLTWLALVVTLGFFAEILTDILIQLRKLNGEE